MRVKNTPKKPQKFAPNFAKKISTKMPKNKPEKTDNFCPKSCKTQRKHKEKKSVKNVKKIDIILPLIWPDF